MHPLRKPDVAPSCVRYCSKCKVETEHRKYRKIENGSLYTQIKCISCARRHDKERKLPDYVKDHTNTHHPDPLAAPNGVCPDCRMAKAANGSCLCG